MQNLVCPTCNGTNVFIEKNQVGICRDCGEIFNFSWEWLVSFIDLKQALFAIAVGETKEQKLDYLNTAKKRCPFWSEEFRDGRLYAEYFNLFTRLKNDGHAEIKELPSSSKGASERRDGAEVEQLALPTNGSREDNSSSRSSTRLGKAGEKGSVRSTQKGVNKPSLHPLGTVRNKRG
jgi:hypothetical protein